MPHHDFAMALLLSILAVGALILVLVIIVSFYVLWNDQQEEMEYDESIRRALESATRSDERSE